LYRVYFFLQHLEFRCPRDLVCSQVSFM
jgi:hypothetical protein